MSVKARGNSIPECFMVCDDEPLSQAQLQLFKDFETVKLKHKKNTDDYYKTYYDPNKTYPQNVTLSSTGAPGPVSSPVVNGTMNVARQVSPINKQVSAINKPVQQAMPRIINVAGAQPARANVPNGMPNRVITSTPMISSVTSLNPQAQQQRNIVQMPVSNLGNMQGAMPQMVNINGQQIRLLLTPQMQSQIQSGARLVFSSGGTSTSNVAPVMARANNTSGPRIMYTPTGQRVIQPPAPQAAQKQAPVTVQRQLQQRQQATANRPQVAQTQAAKRPATTVITPAAKRQKPDYRDTQKENEHYGYKKGKKKYDDDTTSQPKFSCHHCNRRIASNIRFMQHIKNHLEKERQHTFSLNDMINCEHCYKRFRTPFERQCHIEKFHMKTDHVCGVCELSFENGKVLVQHLEEKHPSLQMPYVCKICEYKTSIYDDIIVHFSKTHLGSKSLMCHFCLRILKTAKDFSRHCLKHLTISIRNGSHRCKSCKLMFLSYSELKEHADKDHVRFAKSKKDGIPPKNASKTMTIPSGNQSAAAGATANTAGATASTAATTAGSAGRGTLTVRMPAFNKKSSTPQTPFMSYEKLFRPYDLVKPSGPVWCCECGARVFDPKVHFKKLMQCTKCKFTTFCGETYANHMIVFHSTRKPPTTHPITKVVRKNGRVVLTCKRCKFNTKVPSMMAWHVASACTGGISFMSFQRMIYPAKEKESEKTQEAEEIVILSDDEGDSTPAKLKAPVKKAGNNKSVEQDATSQASSDAGISASNENSQDSSGAQSNASNNNSQLSFATSLSNSSAPDEGSCIGSALAELEGGSSRMSARLTAAKKTVQVNGQ